MKAAIVYPIVIQKEFDELFAKGAVEPTTGGAGFHGNVFVMTKHLSGL